MLSETGNTVCTQHTNAAGTTWGSTKRGSNRGGEGGVVKQLEESVGFQLSSTNKINH